jgi:hypothetical protein
MLAKLYVPLLLVLTSFLCNASSDVKLMNNNNNDEILSTVKVFAALPLNSESLHFHCDRRGWENFG